MKTIKARALNNNPSLNRWRFVIKDEEGSTVFSSAYCYATEEEALGAGKEKEARLKPGCPA